jgi:hypothetical protein
MLKLYRAQSRRLFETKIIKTQTPAAGWARTR